MSPLLTATDVRRIATELDLQPTKKLGQNFVIDANTVRRIVSLADLTPHDHVLEVGPGLGSLTLALLDVVEQVTVVEIDPVLAHRLPQTIAEFAPGKQVHVINEDALAVTGITRSPTAVVANLPYNVSVPVLLHLLAEFPTLRTVLVMVQREVAERLAAGPGSKVYGVPSAKVAWYGTARLAGQVPRGVFWPVPNVDSALVQIEIKPPPDSLAGRSAVFAVIDAAFSQRRKMLRSALASWAGSSARAEQILRLAGVDPTVRGEMLRIGDFVRIADAASAR